MTHDRTYYRQCNEFDLIDAARDSDSELAIALGERLDDWKYLQADIENLADEIADLKAEVTRLEEKSDRLEDENAALENDKASLRGELNDLGYPC